MECSSDILNQFSLILGKIEISADFAVSTLTRLAADCDDGEIIVSG